MKLEKGDQVQTIHGEKLTVLAVKTIQVKKTGEKTSKPQGRFLAKSGGHMCWFPASESKKLKTKN